MFDIFGIRTYFNKKKEAKERERLEAISQKKKAT